MKEKDLREHAVCDLCGKKIGHAQVPLFWTVKIERWGINLDAMQRQTGLAMMLGGCGVIAQIMGPDEEMATRVDHVDLTVCEICAGSNGLPVAVMVERKEEGEA